MVNAVATVEVALHAQVGAPHSDNTTASAATRIPMRPRHLGLSERSGADADAGASLEGRYHNIVCLLSCAEADRGRLSVAFPATDGPLTGPKETGTMLSEV